MKIDRGIVNMVEHVLIRDVDDGKILLNQRAKKQNQEPITDIQKPNEDHKDSI